jgi:hygromycin-B 4-O-kinase
MGRYCAIINSIATVGFWSQLGRSSATFGEFLHQELDVDARIESLARHRILPDAALYRLSAALMNAARRPSAPALNHGDLRLKNVVVNARGNITSIIDWEDCASTLAPEWDWSVALHDLSIDEKQEFLRGYGASRQRVTELAPTVKALNILNYVPEIERLVTLKQSALLQRIRLRLSGALDLYSL